MHQNVSDSLKFNQTAYKTHPKICGNSEPRRFTALHNPKWTMVQFRAS